MTAQKGVTVAATDFPPYVIRMIGESHFLVAGGGGQAKTGVPNACDIFELQALDGSCIVNKVGHHIIEHGAIMNSCISYDGKKDFFAAFGIDEKCHIYRLRSKLITPKVDGKVSEGIRKRKGNLTESSSHNEAAKTLTYQPESVSSVQTDFGVGDGFQKAVQFSRDLTMMVTGGSDGHLRVFKFPELQQIYSIRAHKDEIDDLDISPAGKRIATVSRDCKAFLWNAKDGSKYQELQYSLKTDAKYRFRSCRFGNVIDKPDVHHLYSINIPLVRGKNPAPCYLIKWDVSKCIPKKMVKTGTEVLSSFAISDEGTYLGTGTISGSVSVYIAFSLQRLYHLKGAHSIFVTGLEFASESSNGKAFTGNHDSTLFSISADSQIKLHQVATQQTISVFWPILGFLMCIYVFYWVMVTFHI